MQTSKRPCSIDIGIIFTISRLLHNSISNSLNYLLNLSILFIFYIFWDIFTSHKKFFNKDKWGYAVLSDIFAAICYLILWIVTLKGYLTNLFIIDPIIVIIYIITIIGWF